MTVLETTSLSLGYGGSPIFQELDLSVPKHQITVLIGKNGCGKSTLLRSLARLLKPSGGSVLLDGKDIYGQPTKDVARRLSILPQGPAAPEGLTVLQLVKQGRYPHQTWLKQWSREDESAVAKALEATAMTPFADKPVDALSGGQRQRAWIAMTLAQETGTILLDEPTTYLDLSHQIEVLELLADLNEREGRTIVMVLHDINLACRYAHHIVAVSDGAVYAEGSPSDIIDERLIRDVFAMDCRMIQDPVYQTPMCIPLGSRAGTTSGNPPPSPREGGNPLMPVETDVSIPKQLGFLTEEPAIGLERVYGPTLTSPEEAKMLLDRVGGLLQTDKPAVAASQFTKWYCRSMIAVLYEFSVLGIARSASLRDVSVLFPGEPPFAVYCGGRAVPVSEGSARESMRELTVIRLFAHNWNLLFKSFHALTGIREDLLWENGSMYLHHFYRTWIQAADDAALRERLEDDYRYIQLDAPPELYGELQCFNPFQWTGKDIRGTCCLRHHLPDGNYCKGCPVPHRKTRNH